MNSAQPKIILQPTLATTSSSSSSTNIALSQPMQSSIAGPKQRKSGGVSSSKISVNTSAATILTSNSNASSTNSSSSASNLVNSNATDGGSTKEKSSKSNSKLVSSSSKSSSKESREKHQSKSSKASHKEQILTEYDVANLAALGKYLIKICSNLIIQLTKNILKLIKLDGSLSNNGGISNALAKDNLGQKFTTSNFTETVVMNSDSVFGGDVKSTNQSGANISLVKKRKLDAGKSTNSNQDDINK